MNSNNKNYSVKQKDIKSHLNLIKNKYILKQLFIILPSKIFLEIIRYNNEIQKKLNIDINYYKEYSEIYTKIILEIIPTKNILGNFINISKGEESFYHIYFNDDDNNEIKRYYLNVKDNVTKIKIIMDYQSSFNGLFKNCKCIKSINFIKCHRNNINNTSYLFSGCSSLKKILLTNFKTNNVKNMLNMFSGCSSLKELDLSKFNTENVKDMGYMFYGCSSLEKLNISNFNIKKTVNMSFMFYLCSSLKELNLPNLNNNKIKDMSYMFFGCSSLKELNVSNFVFDKNKKFNNIFSGCSDVLKNKIKAQYKQIGI